MSVVRTPCLNCGTLCFHLSEVTPYLCVSCFDSHCWLGNLKVHLLILENSKMELPHRHGWCESCNLIRKLREEFLESGSQQKLLPEESL